uniref:Solute carrier family 39 member 4 n=1 Tax=Astyanax mexicanus TaxID=7994 RepID=A0A3B1K1M7_ASTMX
MLVMGDGIHNLTDGLAIGVALSQSLTGGLSTSIAVFCHELPHELGDLAVLLAAGWSVRRLALFSLLSALLGYVGVLGGTAMGQHWAQHSPWILTVTAGVFLYLALADMVRTVNTHLPHLNGMFLCLSHVEDKWPLCHVIFIPQGNRKL